MVVQGPGHGLQHIGRTSGLSAGSSSQPDASGRAATPGQGVGVPGPEARSRVVHQHVPPRDPAGGLLGQFRGVTTITGRLLAITLCRVWASTLRSPRASDTAGRCAAPAGRERPGAR
jgi:hypothetical protein